MKFKFKTKNYCTANIYENMEKKILEYKLKCKKPIKLKLETPYSKFIYQNATNAVELIKKNPEKFDNIFSLLDDINSKETYEWVLMNRIAISHLGLEWDKVLPPLVNPLLHENFLEETTIIPDKKYQINNTLLYTFRHDVLQTYYYQQYNYKDNILPLPGEFVIDGGAYNGVTALWMAEKMNNKGEIFSFEPSHVNRKLFNTNIKSNKFSNINLMEHGLWKNKKTLFYDENEKATTLGIDGNNNVSTISIDQLMRDKKISKIHFIKLDVEGAEFAVLQGAKDLLINKAPKLAISIYHKAEDLLDIPTYIKKIQPKYKIYISHKHWKWNETVLFACV